MRVQLMRFVDVWLGVPCCFALTLVDKCLCPLRRKAPAAIRRVAFIQLAESGAVVVAKGAMERLARHFPGAEIYFVTFPLGEQVLDCLDFPRQARIVIRTSGLARFVFDTLAAILRLRVLKVDAVVNLETFGRYGTLLAYLSGAPRRSGFFRFHDEGRYTGDLLTHRVLYSPHVHAVQTYAALVDALLEPASCEPRAKVAIPLDGLLPAPMPSRPDKRARLTGALRALSPDWRDGAKLVLLNMNASDMAPSRRWPPENYLALARLIIEVGDIVVGFIGAPDERSAIEACLARSPQPRIFNLAGRTENMVDLVELFHMAELLVSNDSGPAHLSSLTAVPCLVLFGPETPRIFGPLSPGARAISLGLACSPCISAYNQKQSPCTDNRCMKRISVEMVFEQARAILEGGDKARRNA